MKRGTLWLPPQQSFLQSRLIAEQETGELVQSQEFWIESVGRTPGFKAMNDVGLCKIIIQKPPLSVVKGSSRIEL